MSKKTVKARIREADNKLLQIVALKLSAEKSAVVTSADVIHGLINHIDPTGNRSVERVVEELKHQFQRTN